MASRPPSSKQTFWPLTAVVHRVTPARAAVPTIARLPAVSPLSCAYLLSALRTSSLVSAHQPVNTLAAFSPEHTPAWPVRATAPDAVLPIMSQSSSTVRVGPPMPRDHKVGPPV